MRILAAFFIYLLIASVPLIGDVEYIELTEVLSELDAYLEWNSLREIGTIVAGDMWVVFKVGAPWIVFDYTEKMTTAEIVRKDGNIFFPILTFKNIKQRVVKKPSREWLPNIAVVLIDPGHGGKDPGTEGVYEESGVMRKLAEKDVVLKVGTYLLKLLRNHYPAKRTLMTRSTDVYKALEERVEMANNMYLADDEAIIYISLHANAAFTPKPSGFEVWYLPPDYRRVIEDEESVGSENRKLIPILNVIREEDITIESIYLAQAILNGLDEQIGEYTLNRGLKAETWFVVRNAKMPSVLVEIGFVTNPQETARLADEEYLNKITQGIYNGITQFIDQFEIVRDEAE